MWFYRNGDEKMTIGQKRVVVKKFFREEDDFFFFFFSFGHAPWDHSEFKTK